MSHDPGHRYEWNTIPWRKLEVRVFKLQRRIYQATTRGETQKARRLQKLLATSWKRKKPSGAQGDTGKHREKDCRGRWRKKPDPTTKAETDLRNGPARTRKTSAQDLDTQTRETGRTPTWHPGHA